MTLPLYFHSCIHYNTIVNVESVSFIGVTLLWVDTFYEAR